MSKQDAILHMGKFGSRLGALSGIVVGILIGFPIFAFGALIGIFIGLAFGLVLGWALGHFVGILSVVFFNPIHNPIVYRIVTLLSCALLAAGAAFEFSKRIFAFTGNLLADPWYLYILALSIIAAAIASQRLANWYIKNSLSII
jgi:hypothetical protein